MNIINECKICNFSNHENSTELFSAMDPETILNYPIKSCNNCEIIFTENVGLDIDKNYYLNYRKYKGIANIILNFISRYNVKKWLKRFPETQNVLEIGSGNGKMLKYFSNKNKNVVGTEINKEVANEVKSITNLNIIPENELDDLSIKFDLIFLYHVLEHVVDPNLLLQKLKKLLNTQGVIIIAVPNTNSLQFKFFKNNWVHLDPPRHLFHFNLKSFKYLMHKNSFKIDYYKQTSIMYDIYGWFESILNIFFKEKNNINKIFRTRNNFNIKLFFIIFICTFLLPLVALVYLLSLFLNRSAILEFHVIHDEK